MIMRRLSILAIAASMLVSQAHAACENFVGMNIAGSGGGGYNFSQIWNPATSGKKLLVSTIVFAAVSWEQVPKCGAIWNEGVRNDPVTGSVVKFPLTGQYELTCTRGADLVIETVPKTTLETNAARCKDVADTALGAAEFRVEHVPASGVTGVRPIYEMWPGKNEDDRTYTFDPPLTLSPGTGLSVRGAQPNLIVVTSWQWKELPISP